MTLLARVIATWFFLGYLKAPGTFGTLGAVAVALPLHVYAGFGPWQFAILALAATYPAIWASDVMVRTSGLKDPQFVVIDEVVGFWLNCGVAPAGRPLMLRFTAPVKPPCGETETS